MHTDTVSMETARMILQNVDPPWAAFWFHMHLVAHNLREFAAGLAEISDEVFAYHVSGQKNDLAKWVREVVGDAVLAHRLETVAAKEDAAQFVAERVFELERILSNT